MEALHALIKPDMTALPAAETVNVFGTRSTTPAPVKKGSVGATGGPTTSTWVDLAGCLPDYISSSMQAIMPSPYLAQSLHGMAHVYFFSQAPFEGQQMCKSQ